MNHVMIDIKTMGTNHNAPICSIGAVFFNPKTGELGEQFYCRVDFENDMLNGAVPDGGTIKWWLRQPSDVRAELIRDDATPIWDAVSAFSDWLTDNADSLTSLKVWANSPSFVCTILKSAFERTEIDIPWNFWNELDVRTIKEKEIGHSILDDATNQIVMVSAVMSRLIQNNGGEL